MKVIGTINGAPIQRDSCDLEYIQLDIIEDLVRSIAENESNPQARIEVDLTQPDHPSYHLIDCSQQFEDRFYQLIRERQTV